jgi:hypothetical protein
MSFALLLLNSKISDANLKANTLRSGLFLEFFINIFNPKNSCLDKGKGVGTKYLVEPTFKLFNSTKGLIFWNTLNIYLNGEIFNLIFKTTSAFNNKFNDLFFLPVLIINL